MEKKTIVARIEVRKGKEKEFMAQAGLLIQNTRAEEGNISYNLYQNSENPDFFLFYEEYKDQAAMELHASSKYLKNFGEAVKDLLAVPMVIERY